jgi:hypothetical protein
METELALPERNQRSFYMMYLWLVPLLLFVLLLTIVFVRRVSRSGADYESARRRADVIRHGDEDPS